MIFSVNCSFSTALRLAALPRPVTKKMNRIGGSNEWKTVLKRWKNLQYGFVHTSTHSHTQTPRRSNRKVCVFFISGSVNLYAVHFPLEGSSLSKAERGISFRGGRQPRRDSAFCSPPVPGQNRVRHTKTHASQFIDLHRMEQQLQPFDIRVRNENSVTDGQ